MKCPFCAFQESKVLDSRPTDEGSSIRRRRECLQCQKRFTTYETIEHTPLIIVKKDKTRQTYDRSKLTAGIMRACEKRPVSIEEIDRVVNEIEGILFNSLEREVTSKQVGELVMKKLKELDQVAYVRFASVYRQFKDIQSFRDELNALFEDQR